MKDRFNLIAALAFMLVVATIGGASRADAMSQIPLRLLALAFLVAGLWAPNRVRLSRYRPLFWLLGLAALIPALQLIPLPYEIWSGLPGREFYAGLVEALDLPRSSRPLSLTPELTWNALLSLLVPGAMLVLATQVPVDRLSKLAVATLGIVFVGVVLGFAQIAGGPESGLRFYRVTNGDSMVGLFANRNHHAVLVAMALPIVFALPIGLRANQVWRRIGLPLSALGVLLIGIALFLTGSRAGLLAGALGALGGAAIYGSMASAHQQARLASDNPAPRSWRERLRHPVAAPIAALSMIAVAAAGFASTPAMQRLLKTNVAEEDRAKFFGPILELTGDLLPFGGGFGSFNNLFRKVESVEGLKTVYLNHAHMDLVQIVTEGGWPAAVLFVAFMVWWTRCAINAWRQPRSVRFGDNLGRIGTVSTGVVILASAVDYPLRTPLHMALFVVGCVWLQRAGARTTAR